MIIIAKTLKGLEGVLQQEIDDLGGLHIEKLTRAVKFEGDMALLYRANLNLRTALRLITVMKEVRVRNYDDVYREISKLPWEDIIKMKQTFAVRSVTTAREINHSQFLGLKVKDAIVDRFYQKFGKRPNVNPVSPNFWIDIHVREELMTISLDSSGESLHMRGYRVYPVEAPINEVLAAGMIKISNWDGKSDLLDPMCGSGTIAIEAALIAANRPPHRKTRFFGFMDWADYDNYLWAQIKAESFDKEIKTGLPKIMARDKSLQALKAAQTNAQEMGIDHLITFERKDFLQSEPTTGITCITNPPYDERMKFGDDVNFYKEIGDQLKKNYAGCNFWIISSNIEALRQIGLKTSKRHHLLNGALDAELQHFEIYEGSRRE